MSSVVNSLSDLWKHFDQIEDPRVDYLIEHQLRDIIVLTILAVICGADTWVEIEEYGLCKQSWLATFLPLPNGIPSHDTIARVFARLCPKQLQKCFLSWIEDVAQITHGNPKENCTNPRHSRSRLYFKFKGKPRKYL